jgi:ketosteroid isomerase-like protein
MPATTPEEVGDLFLHYMRGGDLDALLTVYDPEVAFRNRAGEVLHGLDALRQELAPLAAARAVFEFKIRAVIQAGDVALIHNEWKLSSPEQMSGYAIEVAKRQPDGTWRWLIGDPFTVAGPAPLRP